MNKEFEGKYAVVTGGAGGTVRIQDWPSGEGGEPVRGHEAEGGDT